MAVTVEYQSWDSTSYNWLDKTTSTSAPLQIQDKLSSWITAVNANAGNANRQLSIKKAPTDSTSANFIGWVIELASSTSGAGPFYIRFYSSSTTNIIFTASAGWTNDGTNGGYGAASGNSASDSSVSWATSGVTGEFSVATETANGVEFFCLGWRLNNSIAQSDQLLIFKDSNGEWGSLFSDGGAVCGNYFMAGNATPAINYGVTVGLVGINSNSGVLSRLILQNGSTTYVPATGNEYTNLVTPASTALYATATTTEYGFGRWAPLSGGRKAVCMGYGPIWVVF